MLWFVLVYVIICIFYCFIGISKAQANYKITITDNYLFQGFLCCFFFLIIIGGVYFFPQNCFQDIFLRSIGLIWQLSWCFFTIYFLKSCRSERPLLMHIFTMCIIFFAVFIFATFFCSTPKIDLTTTTNKNSIGDIALSSLSACENSNPVIFYFNSFFCFVLMYFNYKGCLKTSKQKFFQKYDRTISAWIFISEQLMFFSVAVFKDYLDPTILNSIFYAWVLFKGVFDFFLVYHILSRRSRRW